MIERFSEDIDIALAPEAFGREYRKGPSSSYVKTLKKEGCAYTTNIIKDALQEQLTAMGVPAETVKVEFGVRSLKEPFAEVPIQSIIAEVFPNPSYSETPFLVAAVEPRKTFMEKLFLLHEKFSIVREDFIIQERQRMEKNSFCILGT